jgi:hypothetical protein
MKVESAISAAFITARLKDTSHSPAPYIIPICHQYVREIRAFLVVAFHDYQFPKLHVGTAGRAS